MIRLLFATILAFSINTLADEEDKVEFDYSAFEINLVQTDSTGVGIKVAFPLPGGLYLVAERKAEEIDLENDSYERIINSARLGIHAGIGDIFSSVSAKGLKLKIENIFDVYAELGIKSTAYDINLDSFSKDDSKANIVAGIRFGDPMGWEGKFFVDFSKDAEIAIKECPTGQVCAEVIEYELDEDTDRKLGFGALYNINKRSAVSLELSTSKIFETSVKIGYQINF